MSVFFFLVIPLHLAATGSMKTGYNASREAIITCIFPKNSTRIEFAVYFYDENDKSELLVDCVLEGDKLDCIEQEGFKCRVPVPDAAEIEVPQTFVTRPGRIGWKPPEKKHKDVKLCHFVENHGEGRKESQDEGQNHNIHENNYDHKASSDFPSWTIGLAIGIPLVVVNVIVIVLYKKICRKDTQAQTSEDPEANPRSPLTTTAEMTTQSGQPCKILCFLDSCLS